MNRTPWRRDLRNTVAMLTGIALATAIVLALFGGPTR